MTKELLEYLSGYLTPQRLNLFNQVIEERTNYLTVVLEDIFQPQNASAVLRTCDCFGIQNVHIIENRNNFKVDREVAMGSSKWLTLKKYNEEEQNSLEAIRSLKDQGYRIVATTPHINDQALHDFDLTKGKAALVFGSELPGVTDTIAEEADEFLKIPMYGFTESFNISVSAAIILHHLTLRMRQDETINWKLTDEEKDDLKLEWIRRSLKRSELIEQRFMKSKTKNN
ncbi:TrmH family RNA methyltransferase [Maribellus sediminis]|uniref:TrmH family RNA methyltransferase n=1 Tax=Maribellus sediminis TaxID=2696285 RepID=UPI0014306BB5|nr:RNA methyltransferase [Maribellus sediminis]